MKKLHLALIVALMISGLFVGQASAATSASEVAASACGKTYTVVGGDNLTKIASLCGTTVSSILDMNPAITNANLIYSGQVIKLTGTATITTSSSTSTSGTSYSGNSYITVSDTTVSPGDSIVVKAYNFPANVSIDVRLFKKGVSAAKKIYDATTNSSGYAKKTVTIPSNASSGQTWVIKVMTQDLKVVTMVSTNITISGGSSSSSSDEYSGATVTLSKTSVSAGGHVTVYVDGFPENQDIDYCVRKKSSSTCKVVYDGRTDSDGEDSLTVTIPESADSGQSWVVYVHTTNLKSVVSDVSPKITIK